MTEEALFHHALALPAAERAAFLDDACGGDGAQRQRIEVLLGAHDNPGSFLAGPAQNPETTPAQPPATDAREVPPTRIGPYKLLQQIGEGGMGTVYMAEQTQPVHRKVALKVIKPGMDSGQVIARFEAERQALALMDHVNIARVFDGGTTENGRPYFVMELVHGVPITRYCDDNHLTPRERLELFVPVCQAIQHAHQKGIIHRDIKPSNVMVTLYDGKPVPKVIDFGVAKATEQKLTERTLFTQYGTMVGTLEYMSPEQAEMSALGVDTRSDIFSLGVLLYELLTGSTPLTQKRMKEAAYAEILRLIKEEEPPRPSTRLSDSGVALASISAQRKMEPAKLTKLVKGELDWIVMKCLEKDRGRRYESANGFAADVQRYLADEPVQACPPSVGYRLRKFARRNRAAVAAAALFAALLLVGTAVSTGLAVWATRAEGQARDRLAAEEAERERATGAEQQAREAEREGKRQLARAKLAQARAGRWGRQAGQRFDGLRVLAEASALARELGMGEAFRDELRDEAVACLVLADVRPLGDPWEGLPAGTTPPPDFERFDNGLGFDADLVRYARGDEKGNVEVRQIEGDRLLARLPAPAGVQGASDIRFSPDGRLLAVGYRWDWNLNQIIPDNGRVWDWQRGKVVFQPTFPTWLAVGVTFSPDGRRACAFDSGERTSCAAVVFEVDGWKEACRVQAGPRPVVVAFHPDGTRLAVAGRDSVVRVLDLATKDLLYKVEAPGVTSVAWHPDGDLLAAGCEDWTVRLWSGADGRHHATLFGHQGGGLAVAFAAGGGLLVSAGSDGSTRLWDPWARHELLRFAARAGHVSRDGRRLAGRAGRTLARWEIDPGREYLTLPLPAARDVGFRDWDVSPDGRWLAGGVDVGRLWDLARRKYVGELPGGGAGARFHPAGRGLITVGRGGVYRWSFEAGVGSLRVTAADRLLPWGHHVELDRGGLLAAVARTPGAVFLDLKGPPRRLPALVHPLATTVALSPDGRWAAAGTSGSHGVKVREVRTGEEHLVLPADRTGEPAFSPDGRWLVTATGSEFGVWEVGTWRQVRRIPRQQAGDYTVASPAAFSPDGAVVALATSLTAVHLYETGAWRPLARLEGPDADRIARVKFTPDGTQLLVASWAGVLRVWNLRRVREGLTGLALDWDQAAYPPSPPAGEAPPVKVEIDASAQGRWAQADAHLKEGREHTFRRRWAQAAECYDRALQLDPLLGPAWTERGQANYEMGRWAESIADYTRGVELDPDHAQPYERFGNALSASGRYEEAVRAYEAAIRLGPTGGSYAATNLAWLLLVCPDPRYRDARRAIELATTTPLATDPRVRCTLGAAFHRSGKHEEAVAVLVAAMSSSKPYGPRGPHYKLLLAQAYWKLGKEPEAQARYRQATNEITNSMDPNLGEGTRRELIEEFQRIRAETAALLGLVDPDPRPVKDK